MSRLQCTYCRSPISGCRIKCCECQDVILCLQCFGCGAEAGGHHRDHKYQVLNLQCDSGLSVFGGKEAWKVSEDELLLEAIELYSFGNWTDIAENVKTKSFQECADHYWTYFINGNIGKVTLSPDLVSARKVTDHTVADEGTAARTPAATVNLSLPEQQELGYMPMRDEFDWEYDDGAEAVISSLSWNYDDEDIDSEFKLLQVDMYRRRMKERERRKRLAKEYGIISSATAAGTKKLQDTRAKMTKDDRDCRDRMRVFAQFCDMQHHDKMHHLLLKEKQVKNRIKELVKFRRNGISLIADRDIYEKERMLREKKKKMGVLAASGVQAAAAFNKAAEESRASLGLTALKPRQQVSCSELLSTQEKKLCQCLGIKSAAYITIKTCIIKDYLQRRHGAPVKIRYPVQLDKVRRRRMLSFFVENGWISVAS